MDLCAAAAATIDRLVHDPKKACPELDSGVETSVFHKDRASGMCWSDNRFRARTHKFGSCPLDFRKRRNFCVAAKCRECAESGLLHGGNLCLYSFGLFMLQTAFGFNASRFYLVNF